MKHLKSSENKKSKIKFLFGMLLIIGALLISTKLVQKAQDTRSSAASNNCGCYKSGVKQSSYKTAASCKNRGGSWVTSGCPKTSSGKTCTWTTGSWSACKDGKKTRTVKLTSSSNCTGGSKPATTTTVGCNTTKTCTYTCTLWGPCSTAGKQTCTNQSKSPSGCTGGTTKIGTTRSCTSSAGGATSDYCTINDKKCFSEGKYEYAGTCKAGASANYWSKVRCSQGCSNGQCITNLSTCASKGGSCISDKSKCNGDYSIEASDCGQKAGGYCCVSTSKGVCGSANGGTYTSAPTSGLCSSGTLSWNDKSGGSGYFSWYCGNAKCSAKNSNATKPACGSANGKTYTSSSFGAISASDLCSSGRYIPVDRSGTDGTFNWGCAGSTNSVSCSAKRTS